MKNIFTEMKRLIFKLYIERSNNKKSMLQLIFLRAISLIGLFLFWISLISCLDNPPDFNGADVSSGEILKVLGTRGGSSGGLRTIVIRTNNEAEEFKTYQFDKTEFLKNKIGEFVIIFSYPQIGSFLLKENFIMEIKFSDDYLFNNWSEVKARKERVKSFSLYMLFLGFLFFSFPLFFLFNIDK